MWFVLFFATPCVQDIYSIVFSINFIYRESWSIGDPFMDHL